MNQREENVIKKESSSASSYALSPLEEEVKKLAF